MLRQIAVLAAAGALAAAPAGAQQLARGTAAQVTPYAGYMIFGKMLEGPLGTSLTTSGGAIYGAQPGINLSPSIAAYGNVARSSGDLRVGIPIVGGVDVGTSTAWLYDGGLQLSLPTMQRGLMPVSPFVQVGAGAMHYTVDVAGVSTNATSLTGNVGLGADVSLAPNIALRLLAKDYFGKFDFKEATSLDVQGKTAHNIGLSAGLKLDF
jgi:hypothetical protein